MGCYFVYEHWRLDTNVCFYVGLGQKSTNHTNKMSFKWIHRRAFDMNRNNKWKEIVAISPYEVRIICSFDNIRDGLNFESELIKKYGRIGFESTGTLINVSPGAIIKNLIKSKKPFVVKRAEPLVIKNKGFYTIKEYSEMKNVSYRTVHKWIKKELLTTTKLPSGRTRIIE